MQGSHLEDEFNLHHLQVQLTLSRFEFQLSFHRLALIHRHLVNCNIIENIMAFGFVEHHIDMSLLLLVQIWVNNDSDHLAPFFNANDLTICALFLLIHEVIETCARMTS